MSPRGAGYLFGSDVVTQVKFLCFLVVLNATDSMQLGEGVGFAVEFGCRRTFSSFIMFIIFF